MRYEFQSSLFPASYYADDNLVRVSAFFSAVAKLRIMPMLRRSALKIVSFQASLRVETHFISYVKHVIYYIVVCPSLTLVSIMTD